MVEPKLVWLKPEQLVPNPWNPNRMDDEMFAKAIESIHRFGFVDPLTARETPDGYQIIDGEHRWRAAQKHGSCLGGIHAGLSVIPVFDVGPVSDAVARQLTIVLNETRGRSDQKLLGALLVELIGMEPLPALIEVLPFTKARIEELAELPSVDWEAVEPQSPASKGDERWTERVYRMPLESAQKVDEAIRAAKADGEADWQALVRVAEGYLE